MPLTIQMIQKASLAHVQPIKLTTIFYDEMIDGKLPISDLNLALLGPDLPQIDFSDCIIKNCNLSYLGFQNCELKNAVIDASNIITGAWLPSMGNKSKEQSVSTNLGFFNSFDLKLLTIDEQSESWSEHNERKVNWMKFMWDQHPLELFKFQNLSKLSGLCEVINHSMENFIAFEYPEEEKSSAIIDHLGWKLHISVHPDDLPKAFDLAAPILSRYCKIFKIVDLKTPENQLNDDPSINRLYSGTQFTIYLEENNEQKVKPDQALSIVQEVTKIFQANNVRLGICPISDKKTISDYFSLRNDKLDGSKVFDSEYNEFTFGAKAHKEYIPATLAGRCYNPLNLPNPYNLLINDVASFDLSQHFRMFEISDRATFHPALILSLYAYLNEHTNLNSLDTESGMQFFNQCISGASLDSTFLKSNSITPDKLTTITQIVCLIAYSTTCRYDNHLADIINILGENKELSDFLNLIGDTWNTATDIDPLAREYKPDHDFMSFKEGLSMKVAESNLVSKVGSECEDPFQKNQDQIISYYKKLFSKIEPRNIYESCVAIDTFLETHYLESYLTPTLDKSLLDLSSHYSHVAALYFSAKILSHSGDVKNAEEVVLKILIESIHSNSFFAWKKIFDSLEDLMPRYDVLYQRLQELGQTENPLAQIILASVATAQKAETQVLIELMSNFIDNSKNYFTSIKKEALREREALIRELKSSSTTEEYDEPMFTSLLR